MHRLLENARRAMQRDFQVDIWLTFFCMLVLSRLGSMLRFVRMFRV